MSLLVRVCHRKGHHSGQFCPAARSLHRPRPGDASPLSSGLERKPIGEFPIRANRAPDLKPVTDSCQTVASLLAGVRAGRGSLRRVHPGFRRYTGSVWRGSGALYLIRATFDQAEALMVAAQSAGLQSRNRRKFGGDKLNFGVSKPAGKFCRPTYLGAFAATLLPRPNGRLDPSNAVFSPCHRGGESPLPALELRQIECRRENCKHRAALREMPAALGAKSAHGPQRFNNQISRRAEQVQPLHLARARSVGRVRDPVVSDSAAQRHPAHDLAATNRG